MSAQQPSMFDDGEQDPSISGSTLRPCWCCKGSGWISSADPIPSAPARPSDPETSHQASEAEPDLRRFSARSRQARLLQHLASSPDTAQAAAIAILGDQAISSIEGCRRRVSDLRAAGYLIDTTERRVNPGSGDLSIVWRASDEGLEALQRLDQTGWSL